MTISHGKPWSGARICGAPTGVPHAVLTLPPAPPSPELLDDEELLDEELLDEELLDEEPLDEELLDEAPLDDEPVPAPPVPPKPEALLEAELVAPPLPDVVPKPSSTTARPPQFATDARTAAHASKVPRALTVTPLLSGASARR